MTSSARSSLGRGKTMYIPYPTHLSDLTDTPTGSKRDPSPPEPMARCCTPVPRALLDFLAELLSPRMPPPSPRNRFTSLLEVIDYCDEFRPLLPPFFFRRQQQQRRQAYSNVTNSFPLPAKDLKAYIAKINSVYHFRVAPSATTLGFVPARVAERFAGRPGWAVDAACTPPTLTLTGGRDHATRTALVAATMAAFRAEGAFAVLEGWRDELKPCYGDGGAAVSALFSVERAAFPLLGIVAYGVMLVAYTTTGDGDGRGVAGLWVQKRSQAARTHAGLLDSTVAGGMAAGQRPLAALVREAAEEASFPTDLVGRRARACGTVSYFHTRRAEMGGEAGLLQPGVHFLYDMEVPRDVEPRSSDADVAGFELMTPERIRGEILAGRAKPWFALAVIDFFVRHGIITEETERDFVEISMRLHRHLEFPVFGVSFLG
ncbi:thiamine pyrophosphokinase-related protein-like protein [Xylaria palmicola]|nr:thiamine pyrophosphokinase-related protein-like protein [Xylaria palmicola]